METPPYTGAVVVVDPNQERLAVTEANKLGIPVFALADTNCNPDLIQWIIPCNDDALKSVRIVVKRLAEAIIEKKKEMHQSPHKAPQDESNEAEEDKDRKTAEHEAVAE
ncbi:SSU ribosomal protein S2p (SAe) [Candidatus Similichlamydia laticola]|uniref:Small ribosomal subunit protein uS2 n=1 Tax=Candidatus Similichlamydia laticola TaxID=2170265 RepID=A0A369KBG6_9BACT|nr:SSU ribosomal protein S2p (SAe) [Candidatus Similichlamydia laticola]